MLFTDWKVLLGIAIAWIVYYMPAAKRHQVALLVLGSIAIYAYEAPTVVALLVASAGFNAAVSHRIASASSQRTRIAWASAGVTINLLILAFFKYNRLLADMLGHELAGDADPLRVILMLPLPIGISFYTFHGISLLVDTLRSPRRNAPQPAIATHARNTFLYLCFFPQLVAGPITKANFFYPQIGAKSRADIDWAKVSESLLAGYFLKLVVANNLANHTFLIQYPYFIGTPKNDLLLLLFGYSIQIFADFAGYSLIAIGLAALFGYRLPDNFNFPYISRSFSEFWTRWHISLSSWLREYLYVPLGGNRKGVARTYFNLMVVMVLGGLWHGAAWSYAVWGAWHGSALVIERLIAREKPNAHAGALESILRGAFVFTVVTLGWLLFKLPDFHHVLAYLQAIWESPWHPGISNVGRSILLLSLPVVLYHAAYLCREKGWTIVALIRQPAMALMAFLIALNSGPQTAFIYFQF